MKHFLTTQCARGRLALGFLTLLLVGLSAQPAAAVALNRTLTLGGPQTVAARTNAVTDVTPPTVSVSLAGTGPTLDTGCGCSWYRSAVQVSLSATDDLSGVDSISWGVVQASSSSTIPAPVPATTPYTKGFILYNGVWVVSYSAQDLAGNVSPLQSVVVYVDTVAPVAQLSLLGVEVTPGQWLPGVQAHLTVNDPSAVAHFSGVSEFAYHWFDQNTNQLLPLPGVIPAADGYIHVPASDGADSTLVTPSAAGDYTLEYFSTDDAGNSSPVQSSELHIPDPFSLFDPLPAQGLPVLLVWPDPLGDPALAGNPFLWIKGQALSLAGSMPDTLGLSISGQSIGRASVQVDSLSLEGTYLLPPTASSGSSAGALSFTGSQLRTVTLDGKTYLASPAQQVLWDDIGNRTLTVRVQYRLAFAGFVSEPLTATTTYTVRIMSSAELR